MSTRTVPMWSVTRLEGGYYLAVCEQCTWQRTFRTIGWGQRGAIQHYASHRGTPDREGEQ